MWQLLGVSSGHLLRTGVVLPRRDAGELAKVKAACGGAAGRPVLKSARSTAVDVRAIRNGVDASADRGVVGDAGAASDSRLSCRGTPARGPLESTAEAMPRA